MIPAGLIPKESGGLLNPRQKKGGSGEGEAKIMKKTKRGKCIGKGGVPITIRRWFSCPAENRHNGAVWLGGNWGGGRKNIYYNEVSYSGQ